MTPQDLNTQDAASRQTLSSELLHELRTPLNHIIGYSEMLVEQLQVGDAANISPDLDKIRTAGVRLLGLIDSRFRAGSLPGAEPAPDSLFRPGGSQAGHALSAQPTWQIPPMLSTDGSIITPSLSGRLLVVDDNEMNRDVLTQRLTRQGHEIVSANNGVEAIEAMRAQAFDLVLLDIMMPEMDGYEVLSRIKSDPSQRHVPVIMISALNEMSSVIRCIELGADDYLCKPFDAPLLKARVGACLERKRAHDTAIQLYSDLEEKSKRLNQLEKQRTDLTKMIVDDLSVPLNSMITDIQEFQRLGKCNENQEAMVRSATAEGRSLLRMIADLLDVDKFEAGTVQMEYGTLSVNDLVASAIMQVSSRAEAKHVTLRWELAERLPLLWVDADKLRRTLINLLVNAVTFTPPSGTVTVEAAMDNQKQAVIVAVRDSGDAIPQSVLDHIFEKFGQIALRQGGGSMSTGMGLAFCKLVVEAHGGDITAQSSTEQGSRFRFSIPITHSKSDN